MNESLLVCISFHYNENRLKYLEQVVLNILSYNLNKTIVVETNQEFKLAIDNNNIIINTHRDLPHPFSLTWMHRQTILNNNKRTWENSTKTSQICTNISKTFQTLHNYT
jgi:hypothetical protein